MKLCVGRSGSLCKSLRRQRSHEKPRILCCVRSDTKPTSEQSQVERRTIVITALVGLATFTGTAPPSQAGLLDGTVEWWKSRKRANSAKLIAPLKVSQQRLEAATAMLANGTGSILDVLQLVRAASLNCYLFEALPSDTLETRASLLTQSAKLSDPCTLRIVLKNVIDFASEEDKERGTQLLNNLILSYQKLDSELEAALEDGIAADATATDKAAKQLATTLKLTYDMEAFVKEMLQVA